MKSKIGLIGALVFGLGLASAVFSYAQAVSPAAEQAGGCHFLNLDQMPEVGGTTLVTPPPNCQGTGYSNGTVVTIMSVPRFYYSHLFWVLSPTPASNPDPDYPIITFVMDQSYIATAIFGGIGAPPGSCRALAFTSRPLEWGGVSNEPLANCGQWYDVGTDVTLTAVPLHDKYFSHWTITPTIAAPYTDTNPSTLLHMSETFYAVANFSLDERITGLTAENDGPTELGQPTMLTAEISSGTNVTFTWAFGDGSFGSGPNPVHIYPAEGVYTATVTASNRTNSQTAETEVTVLNTSFSLYMPSVLKAGINN